MVIDKIEPAVFAALQLLYKDVLRISVDNVLYMVRNDTYSYPGQDADEVE